MYHKHYITTDSQGRITAGWSDGPHRDRDAANAICINDHGGYQFRLFPGGEENPPLFDGMTPLYCWTGSEVVRRTDEEIEADRSVIVAEQQKQARLAELHRLLESTDYAVIKIAEGAATAEEYADVIAQRQAWRAEINQPRNMTS